MTAIKNVKIEKHFYQIEKKKDTDHKMLSLLKARGQVGKKSLDEGMLISKSKVKKLKSLF